MGFLIESRFFKKEMRRCSGNDESLLEQVGEGNECEPVKAVVFTNQRPFLIQDFDPLIRENNIPFGQILIGETCRGKKENE